MSIAAYDDFEPINKNFKPTLPNDEVILNKCKEANLAAVRAKPPAYIRGVKVVGTTGQSFWVKFGTENSLAEARTQHYVAQVLSSLGDAAPVRVPAVYRFLQRKGGKCYTVMEFVDGRICTNPDAQAVGTAVSYLINIKAPADQLGPGPIGGGPIGHDFFIGRMSSVAYPTVDLLSRHINGILQHERHRVHVKLVDLAPEVSQYGLRLCLSDMSCANFMRCGDNDKIVAIDFGASCFLPISFIAMALDNLDPFTQRIARFVDCPPSMQVDALHVASSSLVKYQRNEIGIPPELKELDE